jgi:hypothetical protein
MRVGGIWCCNRRSLYMSVVFCDRKWVCTITALNDEAEIMVDGCELSLS